MKRTRASELQESLQNNFNRWQHLYEHGGSDPFYEDGINLNLVRNHIIYDKKLCEEELQSGEYPQEYFRETPREVENHFMARTEEIKKNAEESLRAYKADGNYLYIICNIGTLSESEKEKIHATTILRYVSGLKESIEKNDYLEMRRHYPPDICLESFASCRKSMEKILNARAEDKPLPMGQLSLFDLFG